MKEGTPKSLKEAVRRALETHGGFHGTHIRGSVPEERIEFVEAVIRDFLAQQFDPCSMSQPSVQHVWQKIRGAL